VVAGLWSWLVARGVERSLVQSRRTELPDRVPTSGGHDLLPVLVLSRRPPAFEWPTISGSTNEFVEVKQVLSLN